MADPWVILTPVLQGTAIIAGVGALYKVMVKDPIARSDKNAEFWKTQYKDSTYSRRRMRTDLETLELGAPSIPPPRPDEEEEDNTRRVMAIARADDSYEKERRERPLNPGTSRALPFDTQADYKDHRARNMQGGGDTPTHVNPKKR